MRIRGAREHNLKSIDLDLPDGVTAVTGVSGSGKSSLVFDTIYHESRRRFLDAFGTPGSVGSIAPAAVDSIEGLGPAVAVAQNRLNRNPGSTVATASGIHPFLRILYARFGERRCPGCGAGFARKSRDDILRKLDAVSRSPDVAYLIPIVRGAYGSHSTLLAALVAGYGGAAVEVDGNPRRGATPLDPSVPHDIDLVAPPGSLLDLAESLGAPAVIVRSMESTETLSFASVCVQCGRWFGELSPKHFSPGAGNPEAVATEYGGETLEVMLAYTVGELARRFSPISREAAESSGGGTRRIAGASSRLVAEIARRLETLVSVGLAYVTLDRPVPTLSRGESQRLRIAVSLVSPLDDMIHVLDEPTIGQHPSDVERFMPILQSLPGPVILVEHEAASACRADHLVDLGPGAGPEGGNVVYAGNPTGLLAAATQTGRAFSASLELSAKSPQSDPAGERGRVVTCRGASLRNLAGIEVRIPIGAFTVVTGVSGSGKSTLVSDVLYASMQSKRPVGCDALETHDLKPVIVDQEPIGLNPRSNPATYTKLADALRDLFAARTGASKSLFTCNRPEGACPECHGIGAIEVSMRYLPSEWIPCDVCGGKRFGDEARSHSVRFGTGSESRELTIDEVFATSVRELAALFDPSGDAGVSGPKVNAIERRVLRILGTLERVGLGYLQIGRPSPTLSGGEAQRIKLAKYLSRARITDALIFLDEPSTGLHPVDVSRLLETLHLLVSSGATVVAVEHNLDIIAAADWIVDLGPSAGPDGGRLIYQGTPAGILELPESATGAALKSSIDGARRRLGLREGAGGRSGSSTRRSSAARRGNGFIRIRGARANNLREIDVDIGKSSFTVITGPSGSGKSSLMIDVLEVEARRRFLESLSMYERQGFRERSDADVDSVSGIGVTACFSTARHRFRPRDDVSKLTGLGADFAVLFSEAGERICASCGGSMLRDGGGYRCVSCNHERRRDVPAMFLPGTYASACTVCHGVRTRQVPAPQKLVVRPDLPICGGALYSPGFFPDGYLCKPYNGGFYLVQALAERFAFDPAETPWEEMSDAARNAFLFGFDELLEVHYENRKGQRTTRRQRFAGFYGWIRDWDVGGTYTDTVACDSCGGSGFRDEYLAVTFGGRTIHEVRSIPLGDLAVLLESSPIPVGDGRVAPSRVAGERASAKLEYLSAVGLDYLMLNQIAHSLSAGESQRLRLAGLLGTPLRSLTVMLDEPSRGMHPKEIDGLVGVIRKLRDGGNTVIAVEHDPRIIAAADAIIELGPGSGVEGGNVVATGTPKQIARGSTAGSTGPTATARVLRGETRLRSSRIETDSGSPGMRIRGAAGNNLKRIDVDLPLRRIVGVCGVSGSGKSTLIIDTLARALTVKRQTTSVAYEPVDPEPYEAIEGAPARCVVIDQARAGMHHPAEFLGLETVFRKLYSEQAGELSLSEDVFRRGCTACHGSGFLTIDMSFLPSVRSECEVCDGTGYSTEAGLVRLRGVTLPELSRKTLAEVSALWGDTGEVRSRIDTAIALGLGYLVLRQPSHTLSGGEVQRLKIASHLSSRNRGETLYLLDEPTVGLHAVDVQTLYDSLVALRTEGSSIVVIEHSPELLSACDWIVELGPGGGPKGGRVIFAGTPEALARAGTPTSPYVGACLS